MVLRAFIIIHTFTITLNNIYTMIIRSTHHKILMN